MTSKPVEAHVTGVSGLGQMLDRRTFLGRAAITAGAGVVAGCAPLVSLRTSQPPPSSPTAAGSAGVAPESEGFRHVDDMWGHWPRYSHPIPHSCSQTETVSWEKADLVDRMWVS